MNAWTAAAVDVGEWDLCIAKNARPAVCAAILCETVSRRPLSDLCYIKIRYDKEAKTMIPMAEDLQEESRALVQHPDYKTEIENILRSNLTPKHMR